MVLKFKYLIIQIKVIQYPIKMDCKENQFFDFNLKINSSLYFSFNLLINGGGSVLIQFNRQPFKTKQYAFIVPWNTFFHIGYIYMDENIENNLCYGNFSENVQPKLWDTSLDRSFINNEQYNYAYTLGSQIIRQSISIDENDLPIKFIYLSSSSTRRYQSILTIVLTENEIDDYLIQIHLSISIEGIYFMKKFQAETGLIYEYEWSRRNAYDQNVHGLAEAISRF